MADSMYGARGSSGESPAMQADTSERLAALAGGAVLGMAGLRRGGWMGVALAAAGGGLMLAGAAGYSLREAARGADLGRWLPSAAQAGPVVAEHSVTVNRPPEELYRFWRNLENLPQVMEHLERVRVLDDRRSHWVAHGPAGAFIEWDAEIVDDQPDRLISWRSVGNPDIVNSGAVEFRPAPGGRGTEVQVMMRYEPPGGRPGRVLARIFDRAPEQQVRDALSRFKQVMEAGEIATAAG